MNKSKKDKLIKEIHSLFEKYDVFLDVHDNYNGNEDFCGQDIEIKSKKFINDRLEILIDVADLAE